MGKTDRDFSIFNQETKEFGTLEDAKEWLKSEYFYCKTTYPIYRDVDGKSVKVGKIYAFKGSEFQDGKKWHYYQQDWIELREVNAKYTSIKI